LSDDGGVDGQVSPGFYKPGWQSELMYYILNQAADASAQQPLADEGGADCQEVRPGFYRHGWHSELILIQAAEESAGEDLADDSGADAVFGRSDSDDGHVEESVVVRAAADTTSSHAAATQSAAPPTRGAARSSAPRGSKRGIDGPLGDMARRKAAKIGKFSS
jgi:hypothetical protein